MQSHFKMTKHIFVDCDYLTSLGVSQVPRYHKLAIFGVMDDDDDDNDRQIHTNRLLNSLGNNRINPGNSCK